MNPDSINEERTKAGRPVIFKSFEVILFGLTAILSSYHLVRFYFFEEDCDYITGMLNTMLENGLFLALIALIVLSAINTVRFFMKGNPANAAWKNLAILLGSGLMVMLFMYNTLMECFMHDTHFEFNF